MQGQFYLSINLLIKMFYTKWSKELKKMDETGAVNFVCLST